MAAKFQLKQGGSGQFMFNLKAGNGEVILTSELYKEKQSAIAGIQSVKVNGPIEARYERKTAKNGQPFFVLKATNGREPQSKAGYQSTPAQKEKSNA